MADMASSGHGRARAGGFTLIELLVVVAIVAILAAIATAAYDWAVRKARRGVAQACLTEAAQFMERFYTINLNYAQDGDGNPPPAPGCSQDVGDHYTIGFVAGQPTATTYAIQAVPRGSQARDSVCGTMSVNERGVKEPAGDCWQ